MIEYYDFNLEIEILNMSMLNRCRVSLEDSTGIDWDEFFEEVNTQASDNLGLTKDTILELLNDFSNFQDYSNRSGRSGVEGFKYGDDWILVKFRDGSLYLYTQKNVSYDELNLLISLAIQGIGLNAYLTKTIGSRYEGRNYRGQLVISAESFVDKGEHKVNLLRLIEAFENGSTEVLTIPAKVRLTYLDPEWVTLNAVESIHVSKPELLGLIGVTPELWLDYTFNSNLKTIFKANWGKVDIELTKLVQLSLNTEVNYLETIQLIDLHNESPLPSFDTVDIDTPAWCLAHCKIPPSTFDTGIKECIMRLAEAYLKVDDWINQTEIKTISNSLLVNFYNPDGSPKYGLRGSLRTQGDTLKDKMTLGIGLRLNSLQDSYNKSQLKLRRDLIDYQKLLLELLELLTGQD